jgi:hypothetical protein
VSQTLTTDPGPHGAWPAATYRWVHGAVDDCATCGGPVIYEVRDGDRRRHGALAGRGGWRHLPAPAVTDAQAQAALGRLAAAVQRGELPAATLARVVELAEAVLAYPPAEGGR